MLTEFNAHLPTESPLPPTRSPTGFLLEPVNRANKPRFDVWFETGVLG